MLNDQDLLVELAVSQWERMKVACDIGGVADVATKASAKAIVGELIAAPEFVTEEISEAIDAAFYPRTIRVATDLSWAIP